MIKPIITPDTPVIMSFLFQLFCEASESVYSLPTVTLKPADIAEYILDCMSNMTNPTSPTMTVITTVINIYVMSSLLNFIFFCVFFVLFRFTFSLWPNSRKFVVLILRIPLVPVRTL